MASKRVLFYLRSSHPDEREMRHIPPEAFQRGRGVYLRNGGVWQAGDIEGVEKDADGVLSLTSEAVGRVVAHREDLLSAYRKHYRLADSDITVEYETETGEVHEGRVNAQEELTRAQERVRLLSELAGCLT